jgi:hypothetical protein
MNKRLLILVAASMLLGACAKGGSSNTAQNSDSSTNTSSSESAVSESSSSSETPVALTEIKFVSSDFPTSNKGYPDSGEVTKDSITLTLHNVMAGSTTGATYAQMKKNETEPSFMKAAVSKKAKSLVIEQYFQGKGYDGVLTVKAGTDEASATTVTPTENTVDTTKTLTYAIPTAAPFVSLLNESSYAFKAISITFGVLA